MRQLPPQDHVNHHQLRLPAPDRLLQFIPTAATSILDCACGDGARAQLLRARQGARVCGIEHSVFLAAHARPHLDDLIRAQAQDLDLPWPEASFDAAICDGLLQRLRDPAPFLSRVHRALRPGGLLVLTAPNLQYYEHFLMLAHGRWIQGGTGALARENIRFFTAYELARLLDNASFSSIRCGVLDAADPTEFPLSEDGYFTDGKLRLGPLQPEQYRNFLAREYVLLGVKNSA